MERDIVCVECPTGCSISVVLEDGEVTRVEGFGCKRGRDYAMGEAKQPMRLITTTVRACGLSLRVVPVKTDRPIPRDVRHRAMQQIAMAQIDRPVQVGDVIIRDLLGLGVDVVATREVI